MALAALMIVAAAHREMFAWAARALIEPAGEPPALKPRTNGHKRHTPASNAYRARRREERDRGDEALLGALRRNSEPTIGELATVTGRSRSSTVSALHRLRDAGAAENVEGHWRLVEPSEPREPTQPWITPLKGSVRAAEHH